MSTRTQLELQAHILSGSSKISLSKTGDGDVRMTYGQCSWTLCEIAPGDDFKGQYMGTHPEGEQPTVWDVQIAQILARFSSYSNQVPMLAFHGKVYLFPANFVWLLMAQSGAMSIAGAMGTGKH